MPAIVDITNQRFGSLVAIRRLGADKRGYRWLCVCDCGAESTPGLGDLRSGNTSSCGCGQRLAAASVCRARSTHGEAGTGLYIIWRGMKARCYSEGHTSYRYYGGRGIQVCEEWRSSYGSFREWALPAGFVSGLSIDRINPKGHYSPDNCRFLTRSENARRAGVPRLVSAFGQTKRVSEWEEETGIGRTTILYRINSGWKPEDAVSVVPDRRNRRPM